MEISLRLLIKALKQYFQHMIHCIWIVDLVAGWMR